MGYSPLETTEARRPGGSCDPEELKKHHSDRVRALCRAARVAARLERRENVMPMRQTECT
jgi:hypothetical protein